MTVHPALAALISRKAHWCGRKPWFRGADVDDLEQDMAVILLTKVRLFNPERGSVESFFHSVLRTHDLMARRKFMAKKRRADGEVVSLETVAADGVTAIADALTTENGDRRIGRCAVSASAWMEHCEERNLLGSLTTAKEMAVLLDLHEFGAARAGRRHGLSRHQVDRLLKKICLRVKKPAQSARVLHK